MPKRVPGWEIDERYLLSKGATILQAAAWRAWHPEGYSSIKKMDDYLKGRS